MKVSTLKPRKKRNKVYLTYQSVLIKNVVVNNDKSFTIEMEEAPNGPLFSTQANQLIMDILGETDGPGFLEDMRDHVLQELFIKSLREIKDCDRHVQDIRDRHNPMCE